MSSTKVFLLASFILFSVHRQTTCMHKLLHFVRRSFSTYTLIDFGKHIEFLNQNVKNKLLIFLGPPASGKGSVSKVCVKHLVGCTHITTGELCRTQSTQQTLLGKQIDLASKFGKLIDDDLMFAMVEESLKTSFSYNTFTILDGLPRTLNQAIKLDVLLRKQSQNVHTEIVRFIANDDFIIEYSTNRFVCPHCKAIFVNTKNSPSIPKIPGTCDFCSENLKRREDDTPEVVQKRLADYRQIENSLLKYYAYAQQNIILLSVESTNGNPLSNQFDDFKSELTQKREDL